MAYVVPRKIGKYTYYYLQSTVRIDGKQKTLYKYLGRAEKLGELAEFKKNLKDGGPIQAIEPNEGGSKAYADVIALLSVAERNGIKEIIDFFAGKRKQGLSVGEYMILAAINRAVMPTTKSGFHEWFDGTALDKSFPKATKDALSSQAFWNNMSLVDADVIAKSETEISKRIVSNYGINVDLLLFDNTNFFTYIDTDNKSLLPQRGHSKEKRSDLRIVGLSLMVSQEHNIPLLHDVYPGNMNDARRFEELIVRMKERRAAICPGQDNATQFCSPTEANGKLKKS
jgi:transposase